ncbi:O-antigen ligase family protein [Altericista sp. CCNU0014]|uniref:O-antigen ligase family protein n=1 Tax=Altericista sp. CCNU0014 TaxID=3082949 RepID=UPI00385001C9
MTLLKAIESIFSVFSILFFSDVILPVLFEQGVSWPSIFLRYIPYIIQIITLFLLIFYRKNIFKPLLKEKFLWLFLFISITSIFWSDFPIATLRFIIRLIQMTTFGIYLAGRYSRKDQLNLLLCSFGIATLLSLVFGLALPGYGIMGMGNIVNPENATHEGAWRGVFNHKNTLGRTMVLTSLISSFFALSNKQFRLIGLSICGLSICLTILSTSKTSLIILITLIILFPFYKALRWSYTVALPFLIISIQIVAGTCILFLGNAEIIAGALGKDLTFTGRTDIWMLVFEKIQSRPILGYGFGGFWRGMKGESGDLWTELKWAIPHSHNGFLDVVLDLGLIGLILFSLTLLAVALRSIKLVRTSKSDGEIYPLMYLTFLILFNLTESSIVILNSIWIIFVTIVLSTHETFDSHEFVRKSYYKKEESSNHKILRNSLPKDYDFNNING